MKMKKVCVCFAHVTTLHTSPFPLMFHPSLSAPSLLFPQGQHDWSAVSDILSGVSRPKIEEQAHSDINDEEFGYLAKSHHLTGYEPKQSDKMITADDDGTPINDPDHDGISDFSKTRLDNTGRFSVPTVCETSVSQISRGDLALQKESEESQTRETEGKQRMRVV